MKKILLLFLSLYTLLSFSQTNQWTWISGDSAINGFGIYGTKGVPAAGNQPGARLYASSWTDNAGNLWLYGGVGYAASTVNVWLNDLWKYNPTTNQWAWMNGDSTGYSASIFGTKGIASSVNQPGTRFYSMTWTDHNGNLWLFGGYGNKGTTSGFMNDLWKYNSTTNQWTWISGDSSAYGASVFGIKGTAAAGNQPGARKSGLTWTDLSGNLWLSSGDHYDPNTGVYAWLDDLWKYDISTGQWAWMSGDNTFNSTSVFGVKGIAAPANKPGSRSCAVSWTDLSGDLWLFGGRTLTPNTTQTIARINDLWKYNIASNQWTWVGGDTTQFSKGIYGMKGIHAATNLPGIRENATSWVDRSGNLWLFGGYGYPAITATSWLNDLWKFDLTNNNWTWISGDTIFDVKSVFGTKGVAAPTNKPGARSYAQDWVDASGNFWLFGGQDNMGYLGDLWGFTVAAAISSPVTQFAASVDTVCVGSNITFTDRSTGLPTSWHWIFTGATPGTSIVQNPTVVYDTAGLFNVKLVVSNNGSADSLIKTALIVINASPVPVLSASDTLICSSDSATVCETHPFTNYHWNTGDTSLCTTTKIAGDYWLTVTDANGCSAISAHKQIAIYPVPSVSIFISGDTLSSFGAVNYHWLLNGDTIPKATAPLYVASQQGLYTVQVTDTNGCTTISSPITITGINILAQGQQAILYPNPALTGNFQLNVSSELIGNAFEVYDGNGRLIYQSQIRNLNTAINLNIASGIYWLRITSANTTIVKKLVRL